MIVVSDEIRIFEMLRQLAARDRFRRQACIHTGLIQRQRILGYEHADVRQDRHIVFPMAVTVRTDVDDQ